MTTVVTAAALGRTIAERLAEPFHPSALKWKPQNVSGPRCLPVAFIDARMVADRLNEVMGIDGWQTSLEAMPGVVVKCRLMLLLGGQWVAREDLGGQSEQPDEGDRNKAAASDALKRAAIQFGIGRYLYNLKVGWVNYDRNGKPPFAIPTDLPVWALPYHMRPPASGAELKARLVAKETELVVAGKTTAGTLIKGVRDAGLKAGLKGDINEWELDRAVEIARQTMRQFA